MFILSFVFALSSMETIIGSGYVSGYVFAAEPFFTKTIDSV